MRFRCPKSFRQKPAKSKNCVKYTKGFRCPKSFRQKPPKSRKCVPNKIKENYKFSDYDDEFAMQDFDAGFEEFYECNNPNAAYLHDNGMVWDNKEKYIGRFVDGEFRKA
jgi:hypothetical protein